MTVSLALLALLWVLGSSKAFAEVEIDLEEASKPTPTPVVKLTPTPANAAHKKPTETPVVKLTPTPVSKKEIFSVTPTPSPMMEASPTPEPEDEPGAEKEEVSAEEPSSTPGITHGVLKMKDIYEAGIKAYQEKDYDQAIRYLKKAVGTKDKYSPKFYYAEAYAMLGVIYQFHIIRYQTAYTYYKEALKYERNNETARKHLREVAKHLHKRY